MERLWAPWRMAYIQQPTPGGCIFCDKPGEDEREAGVIKRGQTGFIMLNAFPYNNGHLLVAPFRHVADVSELTSEERLELMNLTDDGIRLLKRVCNPDGFNVGVNLGHVAGAGVDGHIHFHRVPRWNGDTNFMPVGADVKVLPEALDSVWCKLREALEEEKAVGGEV